MTYNEVKRDFERLEGLISLDDAVAIDSQVFDLMAEPTKHKAKEMYMSCIELWFGENRILLGSEDIAEKYLSESMLETYSELDPINKTGF